MSVDVGLALKIGLVEGFLEVVEKDNDGGESDNKLIAVIRVYRDHLRNLAIPLETIKQGILQAELLLCKLFDDYPEDLAGWSVGLAPNNRLQQFANSLRKISMELQERR